MVSKKRIAIYFVALWLMVALSVLWVWYEVLPKGYEQLQIEEVNRFAQAAQAAFNRLATKNDRITKEITVEQQLINATQRSDYAQFDNYFTDDFLHTHLIDGVIVFNNLNQLSYARILDSDEHKLQLSDSLIIILSKIANTSGFVNLANDDYIVSSYSFVGEGEGKVILINHLSDVIKKQFSEQLEGEVVWQYPNFELGNKTSLSITDQSDSYIVSIKLDYVNKVGHSMLLITYPARIRALGRASNAQAIITVLAVGLGLSLLLMILIYRYLGRVELLKNRVRYVAESRNFVVRMNETIKDDLGTVAGYIDDLLNRIELMIEQLNDMANIDAMTGALTRVAGMRVLEKAIQKHKFAPYDLTICFVDIDNLKLINDSEGHNSGDEYIKKITSLIFKNTRMSDTVARFGGDEFIIILPNCTEAMAEFLLERVLSEVEEINNALSRAYPMSFSYGIARYEPDMDILAFLELADQRMYRQKRKAFKFKVETE